VTYKKDKTSLPIIKTVYKPIVAYSDGATCHIHNPLCTDKSYYLVMEKRIKWKGQKKGKNGSKEK